MLRLVNRALALLGAGPLTSLDDPVEEARQAAQALPTVLREIAQLGDWPPLIRRAQLVAVIDLGAVAGGARYRLPVDCITLRSVNGSDLAGARGGGEWWRIEGNDLVGPESSAAPTVDYVAAPVDPDQLPPLAEKAAAYRLAADLAYPLTGDIRVQQTHAAAAERAIAEARRELRRRPAVQVEPLRSEWLGVRA